jgi:hypothetical protein
MYPYLSVVDAAVRGVLPKHAEKINEELMKSDNEVFGDESEEEEVHEESRKHHHHHHHRHSRKYDDNEQPVLSSHKGKHHHGYHHSNDYECRIELKDPVRHDEVLLGAVRNRSWGGIILSSRRARLRGGRIRMSSSSALMSRAIEADCWRESRHNDEE